MSMKDTFCSYCGDRHWNNTSYPRTCRACTQITWANPAPVAVTLVPANEGLVVVRRNIEPQKGKLALPGGYMDLGESWQQACAREVREEAGISILPEDVKLFDVASDDRGYHFMVYGLAPRISRLDLSRLTYDHEVSEVLIIGPDFDELAFPNHTRVARRYFDSL